MSDFWSFRKMLTPVLIQLLFWIGVVVSILQGMALLAAGPPAGKLLGLLILIAGPVVVRVYCELMILLFRIHDTLNEIRQGIDRMTMR